MPKRTHREWFDKVSKLREQLATEPADLKIAQELWTEMGATPRYNVRTGRRAIETFQSSALKSNEGLEALIKAIRNSPLKMVNTRERNCLTHRSKTCYATSRRNQKTRWAKTQPGF